MRASRRGRAASPRAGGDRRLLPAFFFTAGLGVELAGLGRTGSALLGLTLALAVAGKFVGTALPARLLGLSALDALRLGALMNTRGLTNGAAQRGARARLLGPRMYAVLVLCAVATTAATGPLLRALDRSRRLRAHAGS